MRKRGSSSWRRSVLLTPAALVLVSSGLALAGHYRPLTKAVWVMSPADQANPDIQFSPDLKTRTQRLPPVSSINSDVQAQVSLEYGQGDNYGAVAVERDTPAGAQVTCPTLTPGATGPTCTAKMSWLRTLTQDTTVRLRAKSMTNQIHYLDWRFLAPPNLVFLSRIDGPASAVKGNVADFSLVLAQPAPAAISVEYQVDPGSCFSGTRAGQAQGTVTFAPGQQYKTLTLSASAGCTSGNAILKTWTHEKQDQSPYYKTKSFTLVNPRR